MMNELTHSFEGYWTNDLRKPIKMTITASQFEIVFLVEEVGSRQQLILPMNMCRDLLISFQNIYNAQPK